MIRKPNNFVLRAYFIICLLTSNVLLPTPYVHADEFVLPKPGIRVSLSPEFIPAHLKGIVIHPENAMKFDFIVYKGDQNLSDQEKQIEYKKLIKYFLASLAVPDQDQWVNLSPYEKNRIITDNFGKTEMGRDLLAQDYLLKQITSSLIYPEGLGKNFWDRVYSEAYKQYGNTNVPVNTFNKVWIVPDNVLIYEKGNMAYVLKSHLKVMLEEDYLAIEKSEVRKQKTEKDNNLTSDLRPLTSTLSSNVIREIIIPALEKEVNEGKNFANLRQVYSGMILAAWYKRALKESLLGKVYVNKSKLKGVDQKEPKANEAIYQHYLQAFKKGAYNYIKEDVDKYTQQVIPRRYFSGGVKQIDFAQSAHRITALNSQQDIVIRAEISQGEIVSAVLGVVPAMAADVSRRQALWVILGGTIALTVSGRNVYARWTVYDEKGIKLKDGAVLKKEDGILYNWPDEVRNNNGNYRPMAMIESIKSGIKGKREGFYITLVTPSTVVPEDTDTKFTNIRLDIRKVRIFIVPEDTDLQSLSNQKPEPDSSNQDNAQLGGIDSNQKAKQLTAPDAAMAGVFFNSNHQPDQTVSPGGIDLNTEQLKFRFKREGKGMVLPWPKQDMATLSHLEGLEPVILEIRPAMASPLLSEFHSNIDKIR